MKRGQISIFFIFLSVLYHHSQCHKVTLAGYVNSADGVGQHTISFMDCLYQEAAIQLLSSGTVYAQDIAPNIKAIINNHINIDTIKTPIKAFPSKIAIFTPVLWNIYCNKYLNFFAKHIQPGQAHTIKLAYSVTERSKIHKEWVQNLNNYFDAVLVPDDFLVDVYINSGVQIPVFVLPLAVKLEDCLTTKKTKKINHTFVFGCSSRFTDDKNQSLLIDAFAQEFGNDPNVVLRLHGRGETFHGDNTDFEKLKNKVNNLKLKNITLIKARLSRKKYVEFLASLDCYVLVSKGEGFSITPREVLALGIPCILSNNSAHKTICNTGYVYAVPSDIVEPGYCWKSKSTIGVIYNCSVTDVRKALREVYSNYQYYKEKATMGKVWVKQYLTENLKQKYVNVIKSKNIIFGDRNEVTNEYLMTNSIKLFTLYKSL